VKEIKDKLPIIVKACEETKALDIKVLDIKKLTSIADYFIIASGSSTAQVKAIVDKIDEAMYKNGSHVSRKEGYLAGKWVLLDYGDIIVHVFHGESRKFYDIERLWADGKEIMIDTI